MIRLENLSNTPAATLFIVGTCVSIYTFQIICEPNVHNFTMNPRQIIYLHEYYRIITSTIFHANFMHIGMNMMSFIAIGSTLERQFGTVWHAFTILWSIFLTAAVYIFTAYILYFCFGTEGLMYQHSVGFSGVIFHLSVIQSNLNQHSTRSLFGMINVPSASYPWVLLVVLQFLMPNLSFMGHLAGIIVGTLQVHGLLKYIFPTKEFMRACDEGVMCQRIQAYGITYSQTSVCDSFHSGRSGTSSLTSLISKGILYVLKFLRDVGETLKVVIFGRGSGNENIQFLPNENESVSIVIEGDDIIPESSMA